MTAAIEIRSVEKRFGNVGIIHDLNLSVAQGERHAVIGPNGAGKSTTFNLISGYIAPTSGEIRLNGDVISGLRPFEINRRGLSRSFQVTNVFARMTVWENSNCGQNGCQFRPSYISDDARDVNAAPGIQQNGLFQPSPGTQNVMLRDPAHAVDLFTQNADVVQAIASVR